MEDEFFLQEDRDTSRIARMLSKAIEDSVEYRKYRQYLDIVKRDPELYEQVNELRRRNFSLQNNGVGRISYEEFTNISAESKRLRDFPTVNEFLNAEIELGRMIQDISKEIMSGIYFDSEFLG